MRKNRNHYWSSFLLVPLAVLALAITPAMAADSAGKVVTLTGVATSATPQGAIRLLKVGSDLNSGDTVATNPNSYVRMKFSDGGYVILRPNTRFVIQDYRDTGDTSKDRSIFSLLKGGFRAITGLIGKRDHNNYKIRTTVATIGIRGTEHEGRICDNDCLDIDPPPPNGLYTHTFSGGTDVNGHHVGPHQFSFTDPHGKTNFITKGQAKPLTSDPIPPADPADCEK
jgi:hypothetical protein